MKKSLYIFSNGEIKRKQNTIYFESNDGNKRFIPVENIGEIYIFGEVSLNKKLLDFLSQNQIILHFYNYYGFYSGSYYPREHYNSGIILLKQVEHYINTEKRIVLARAFVSGAIVNMTKVLQYYKNRGCDLGEEISRIEGFSGTVLSTNSIDELMALEGNVRDIYYRAFNKIIDDEDFHFERRERRPPGSRINALISFGNSMLYTYCLSEIYKTHLDPRIGFLHASNFRRFSLNLDVAEVFKPVIVDRVVFSLVNKKMLGKEHFIEEMRGLYLNDKGKRIFVQEMDHKLKTTIKHPKLMRSVSYRTLIKMECHKIEKHLLEEENYEPFVARW